MKICICGGGNLGHVTAGFLAAHGIDVSLLTRHPERWQRQLAVSTPDGSVLRGTVSRISSDPHDVVGGADMVLLCLPGFSIHEELLRLRPLLAAQPATAVGSIVSSTGFFFEAMALLPPTTPLFGFQRVPFIARTTEYGHAADLLGYKPTLHVAIEQTADKERLRACIEQMLLTPTVLLGSHYEASLTNSNPILHPSRLYSMWNDWHEGMTYPRQSLFYEEWTDESSELLIAMDREFFHLLDVLPVRKGSIPTILDYYESSDSASLTAKLRSIKAFQGIKSPMKACAGGYVPDFGSRYFTEDFPYGLQIISRQAVEHHVGVPTINRVLQWGLQQIKTTNQ